MSFLTTWLHHVLVVADDVLVLLRGPAEPFRTVLAAVRVVFRVDGDDVPLEAGRVPGAVVAVLALVDPALAGRVRQNPRRRRLGAPAPGAHAPPTSLLHRGRGRLLVAAPFWWW